MLLIGDIHITTKYASSILEKLRSFVMQYPREKSIIFAGDFVYHFSYDRKALLQLYGFFLELFQDGKEVYVLAGNHDRIQEHFVYAESQQAFAIMQGLLPIGKLEFITKPCRRQIEGKQIFFLPFHLIEDQPRGGSFDILLDSSNKQEQQSGRVNALVERELLSHRQQGNERGDPLWIASSQAPRKDSVYLIHHRYIADQIFPGQQATFSYKSPALSSQWLDTPGLKMISGHLHTAFSYKNYLCLGSVRHTSPLEYNQSKFCFMLRQDSVVDCSCVSINPYIHTSLESLQSPALLETFLQANYHEQQSRFASSQWDISYPDFQLPDMTSLHITIRSDDLSYDMLQQSISPEIFASAGDVSIKKQTMQMDQFVALLETGSKQLTESMNDWKGLLLAYIRQKFGVRSEVYEEQLRSLKLL